MKRYRRYLLCNPIATASPLGPKATPGSLFRLFRPTPLLLVLSLLAFCLSALAADEPPANLLTFAQVVVGQRIKITRLSGASFTGTVASRTDASLRLDLSSESDGLSASLDLPASSIKRIQLLPPLDPAAAKAVLQARQVEAERALEKAAPKTPPASTTPPERTEGTPTPVPPRPLLTDLQILLLRTFPPDQWSANNLAEIRRRWITLGLTPSVLESDFVRYYPQWLEAVRQLDALRAWELEHRDVVLLETYPPDQGWSPKKHDDLAARQAAGKTLTDVEATFLEVYPDWLKAYEEREEAKKPAAETPVQDQPEKPADQNAPEKPQEPPADKPADQTPDKPADQKPETPAPAPVPDQPKQ